MKKYTITILLVMVFILTMAKCINSDNQLAAFAPTVPSPTENVCTETFEKKVKYLTNEEIEKMSHKEVSDFFTEMVYISETETLSINDMNIMGSNFYNIWNSNNSSCNQDEFELQAYTVFCNVYEQATKYHIPLENLSSWTNLPITDILLKYFSSTNFNSPEQARCYALWLLNKDDATRVAEVIFENPLLDTNTSLPSVVILLDYNNSATDMAWSHFDKLSRCISPETSKTSQILTTQFCESLLTTGIDMKNIDKIAAIVKNILENPYYDTSIKYIYFCNAFYNYDKEYYTDDTISNIAIDSLFELAKSVDLETYHQLKEVSTYLNSDIANKLICLLEKNLCLTV